jgi:preprotein translocase subunit SecA
VAYAAKGEEFGEQNLRGLERFVMLSVIDSMWMDHLSEMDYLKDGIGLRAMGQRDPLVEYKAEAYNMFEGLVASINESFLRTIMHVQIQVEQAAPVPSPMAAMSYSAPSEGDIFGGLQAVGAAMGAPAMQEMAAGSEQMAAGAEASRASGPGRTYVKDESDPYANVGRNDPCPCGSGKKYKRCHGAA